MGKWPRGDTGQWTLNYLFMGDWRSREVLNLRERENTYVLSHFPNNLPILPFQKEGGKKKKKTSQEEVVGFANFDINSDVQV